MNAVLYVLSRSGAAVGLSAGVKGKASSLWCRINSGQVVVQCSFRDFVWASIKQVIEGSFDPLGLWAVTRELAIHTDDRCDSSVFIVKTSLNDFFILYTTQPQRKILYSLCISSRY